MTGSSASDRRIGIVTGGTAGMGLEVARRMAERGDLVVLAGRRAEAGRAARDALASEGLAIEFVSVDVSDGPSVQAAVASVADRHGRLDWAVNNAGVTVPHARIADSDAAAWTRAIDVNLTGTYNCLRAELGVMAEAGGGAIVNNSSLAGITAIPGQAGYVASKFGVIGLTRAAAIEYARDPCIRINAVAPGPITGGMNDAEALAQHPERTARKIGVTAMRRMGEPGEVASAVAWLLSDDASYVTGAILPIAGGAAVGVGI